MGVVGESIAAVVFSLVGGVMNATWPLFCKPESPRVLRVATTDGWEWENVWLPFIIWSTALNVIFCVWVVGPSALSAVYREASSRDLGLVCTFSFLWGSGTACFSLGVQLLGAGPGTAIVMSLLVVIGTLLPLIEDHSDDAGSPAAIVTIIGLLFAISGFVLSAQSSRIKASTAEATQSKQIAEAKSKKQVETELASFDVEASPDSPKKAAGGGLAKSDPGTDDASASTDTTDGVTDTRSKMHKVDAEEGLPPGPTEDSLAKQTARKTSHLAAVAVCVAGAVMSSMLQFSFVYGDPLVTHAEEEEGVSGAAAPLVVWLLAFSLASVWNVVYAMYLLFRNDTWGRYEWKGWTELFRKFRKITMMAVLFVGHIHFYGQSQYLFGDLGPVVAWPLIMSSTVLSGQLWGVFMKEWVGVPRLALKANVLSICLLVIAVTVIAVAGSVL
eukprot:g16175.t1